MPCPNGIDGDCPEGQTCFTDAAGCPPYVGGGMLPTGGSIEPSNEMEAYNGWLAKAKQIKCISKDDEDAGGGPCPRPPLNPLLWATRRGGWF